MVIFSGCVGIGGGGSGKVSLTDCVGIVGGGGDFKFVAFTNFGEGGGIFDITD